KGNNVVTYVHAAFAGAFPGAGHEIPAKLKTTDFSPEVTLTWRPLDSMTLWGAYKTAYKSGGYANPPIAGRHFDTDNITFEPEEVEGVEIGLKSLLLDGRARFNLTLYTYEFDNLQVTAFNPVPPAFFIQNAASSENKGAEVDIQYLVGNSLQLQLQFGYNDMKYTHYPDANCYPGQPVGPTECIDA